MSRKCLCDQLLGSDFVQIRLRLVPASARWVWLMLAKAMAVSDEPGVLRFGSGVGLFGLVSAIASVSETEAETELENLVRVGLLVRSGEGEIAMPAPQQARSRRAEAARANGLRGGRPKRDGSDRGQAALPLAIPGGLSEKPRGNPAEPCLVSPTTTTASTVSSSSSESGADWVSVAREACDMAGFDEGTGLHTYAIVKDWLAVGATADLIFDVIRRKGGRHVRSLKYFDAAVREAIQSGRTTSASADPNADKPQWEREARRDWNEAIAAWQAYGRNGAPPDLQAFIERARPAAA